MPGLRDKTIWLGTPDSQILGGLFVAAVSGAFCLLGLSGIIGMISWPVATPTAALFGGFGTLLGVGFAMWTNSLELRLDGRTYRRTTGWRNRPKVLEGSFDEMSRLVLRKEQRARGKHTITAFPIYILWAGDPNRKDQIAIVDHASGYERAYRMIEGYSFAMALEFRDETGRTRIDLSRKIELPEGSVSLPPMRIVIRERHGTITAEYPSITRAQATVGMSNIVVAFLIVCAVCTALPLVYAGLPSKNGPSLVVVFGLVGLLGVLLSSLLFVPIVQRVRAAGGMERLTLDSNGLRIQVLRGATVVTTKRLKLADLIQLRVEPKSDSSSNMFLARIAAGPAYPPFAFGEGLEDHEREWLAARLGSAVVALTRSR